jgi:uncharacterized protein
MWPLLVTIFMASLVGSAHCAGMCGAFLAFAVGGGPDAKPVSRTALHAAYNVGRLITYVLLGAAGGALGAAMDLGGSMVGVQRTAAIASGLLMVMFGAVAILRLRGAKISKLPIPRFLQRINERGHRAAFGLAPLPRAAVIGLLTTLLPCGWLYAFVITAAGTGSPIHGAAAMAVFWAGTLPMMVSLGAGLQMLTGVLRARLPLLTSIAIVCVGVYTITTRMALADKVAAMRPHTGAALVQQAELLDPKNLPCHDHRN